MRGPTNLKRKLVPAIGQERHVAGGQRPGTRLQFPTAVGAGFQPVSLRRLGGWGAFGDAAKDGGVAGSSRRSHRNGLHNRATGSNRSPCRGWAWGGPASRCRGGRSPVAGTCGRRAGRPPRTRRPGRKSTSACGRPGSSQNRRDRAAGTRRPAECGQHPFAGRWSSSASRPSRAQAQSSFRRGWARCRPAGRIGFPGCCAKRAADSRPAGRWCGTRRFAASWRRWSR